MRWWIALSRLLPKSTTGAAAEALKVCLAIFEQRFSLRLLFGRQNRGDLCLSVPHGSPDLLMKRPGARLIFGGQRTLASLLTKLSPFFPDSFVVGEGLLDDGANLTSLIVSKIKLLQYAGSEIAAWSGATTEAAACFTPKWAARLGSRGLALT